MHIDLCLALTSGDYLKLPLRGLLFPSFRRFTRHYVRTTQLPRPLLVIQGIIICYLSLTLDAAYILHRFTILVEQWFAAYFLRILILVHDSYEICQLQRDNKQGWGAEVKDGMLTVGVRSHYLAQSEGILLAGCLVPACRCVSRQQRYRLQAECQRAL